jgi:hypothetical protein
MARQLNKATYITKTGKLCACGYVRTQQRWQTRNATGQQDKHNLYLSAPLGISK